MKHTLPNNAERRPSAALLSSRVSASLPFAPILMALVPVLHIGASTDDSTLVIGGVVALLLVLAIWGVVLFGLIPFRHRHFYYAVDSDQITIQRGAFVITRIVVPFARVQNIETVRGPLDRKLGLANVKLFTAATPVTVDNISAKRAEELRILMNDRVKRVRDELIS